jgi:Domain of unknown function (DUF4440)
MRRDFPGPRDCVKLTGPGRTPLARKVSVKELRVMTLPSQSGTDSAAVVETMRAMFAAATQDDEASLKAIFAADFYAFDGGGRFDGMELAALIRTAHAAGKSFVWTVNEPDARIEGDWAWIAYLNRGSITDAAGTVPMTWLESAVLNFDGNRWRIRFFHSTRARSVE